MNDKGVSEFDRGNYEGAVELFNSALSSFSKTNDKLGEAITLNNLASAYSSLSSFGDALRSYEKSLPIFTGLKKSSDQRIVLHNIGVTYSDLAQHEKAFDYYSRALRVPDYGYGGYTYNCMGAAYASLGQHEKSIETFKVALAKSEEDFSSHVTAAVLNNMGLSYHRLGRRDEALAHLERALEIGRRYNDPQVRAVALHNLGSVYRDAGQFGKSVSYFNQALAINLRLRNLVHSGNNFHNLMLAWSSRGRRNLAIFYGKQAVNAYQGIRRGVKDLGEEVRTGFVRSKEDTYRGLADLLITEGRLPEAQQVLELLKEEEYFEFVRRDTKAAPDSAGGAYLTAAETAAEAEQEKRYKGIVDRETAIRREYTRLLAKRARTPDEELQYAKLKSDLEAAEREGAQSFQSFLDKLSEEFGNTKQAARVDQLRDSQALMEDLRELGPGAVALYTLVGENKYRVILVTQDSQRAYKSTIKADDLNLKIAAYRARLQNPQLDPLPLAQELYQILIGPVDKDLKAVGAETLMWSLDGALRYLPIAALHDGDKYMVERYRNAVFTPASNSRLKDAPGADWKGLGLGVSKAQLGASALPAVEMELQGIIRDARADGKGAGVLPGRVLLNEEFTKESMREELRQRYSVVHVASHFHFKPGNELESFLLLGDGQSLTLAEIRASVNLFSGVELLTLSACNTAMGAAGADGKEVEGFGVLAQRQGAKAIIATLWPVADQSTQELMENFYKIRAAQPTSPKAEALRRAQLTSLLGGEEGTSTPRNPERGIKTEMANKGTGASRTKHQAGSEARYSHPYLWAPFILVGNWR